MYDRDNNLKQVQLLGHMLPDLSLPSGLYNFYLESTDHFGLRKLRSYQSEIRIPLSQWFQCAWEYWLVCWVPWGQMAFHWCKQLLLLWDRLLPLSGTFLPLLGVPQDMPTSPWPQLKLASPYWTQGNHQPEKQRKKFQILQETSHVCESNSSMEIFPKNLLQIPTL